MLNYDKLLPKPKVPGFYNEIDVTPEANSLLANPILCSVNEVSINFRCKIKKWRQENVKDSPSNSRYLIIYLILNIKGSCTSSYFVSSFSF